MRAREHFKVENDCAEMKKRQWAEKDCILLDDAYSSESIRVMRESVPFVEEAFRFMAAWPCVLIAQTAEASSKGLDNKKGLCARCFRTLHRPLMQYYFPERPMSTMLPPLATMIIRFTDFVSGSSLLSSFSMAASESLVARVVSMMTFRD